MKELAIRLQFFAATTWERVRRRLPGDKNGKRMLVHEILAIQVLSAALFGGLAIASLYWGGQWVLIITYLNSVPLN